MGALIRVAAERTVPRGTYLAWVEHAVEALKAEVRRGRVRRRTKVRGWKSKDGYRYRAKWATALVKGGRRSGSRHPLNWSAPFADALLEELGVGAPPKILHGPRRSWRVPTIEGPGPRDWNNREPTDTVALVRGDLGEITRLGMLRAMHFDVDSV